MVSFLEKALFQKNNKMAKSTYRTFILARYKLGKSIKEIRNELTLAYLDGAVTI